MVMMVASRAAALTATRLGRYDVIKHLADGGMAEVLLGRTTGIEGFERHVVIKRIRAEQAHDQHYVTMFLDEARLAATLHHVNVVQVNDIGQEDGEYFFAMEYVHGEDVRKLLADVAARDARVPLEHALTIVMAAASGLHYAHEQVGPDRKPLGIVHRDVSPANILIGYDGAVKVVDFGIAKAAHQSKDTGSGVLKGKATYMSPEQCNVEEVDRRSDVFALGVVLWELVTARPLFHRENDFLTMTTIVKGDYERPSAVRPDVPPELEAIIMKALARDRDARYATADDMRVALEQFADSTGLRTSTTALADYMKTLFGRRPEPWQSVSQQIAIEDIDDVEMVIDAPPPPEPVIPKGPTTEPMYAVAPWKRRRAVWIAAACVGVLAIGVSIALVSRGRSTPATPPETAHVAPAPVQAAPPPPTPPPAPAAVVESPVHVPVVEPAKPAPKKHHAPKPVPAKHWDPKSLFPTQ
jgi:serine/threonine protein kinase